MEYEKSCMASASDITTGQNTFLGNVTNNFREEGFHTLRRYLETLPDVKNVTNLLLRSQRYISAGSAFAKKAMQSSTDVSERANLLSVRDVIIFCLFCCCPFNIFFWRRLSQEASRLYGLGTKDAGFYKTCTDEYVDLLKDQKVRLATSCNKTGHISREFVL